LITFVRGTLVEKHPTRVIVDVGGVGYEVFIPLSSYDRLPETGAECRMLTHDHVRDDAHQLFGFVSEAERRMFNLLLTVSGVGPKLALSALSGLSVRELKAAAVDGDIKRLSSISGIGRKTAERIAVELRHKLDAAEALEALAGPDEGESDARVRDAVLALASLGYKQSDGRRMVRDVLEGGGAGLTVEDIIRKALAR